MEGFLTVDDLAEGLKVNRVWLYKLVREKRIPFYRIEKCVRFSPSEISAWLEERRMKEWRRDREPRKNGVRPLGLDVSDDEQ